jgi:hypothetical protein
MGHCRQWSGGVSYCFAWETGSAPSVRRNWRHNATWLDGEKLRQAENSAI